MEQQRDIRVILGEKGKCAMSRISLDPSLENPTAPPITRCKSPPCKILHLEFDPRLVASLVGRRLDLHAAGARRE